MTTLEMIAEQLWNRGWQMAVSSLGPHDYRCYLTPNGQWTGKAYSGNGNSALLALERARAELDKEQAS